MKAFIVLSAVIVVALANGYGDAGQSYGGGQTYATQTYAAPIVTKVINQHTGQSWQYRKQDGWGNYEFGYNEQHNDAWGSGGSSRNEKGDSWGNKEGSYSLNVGDGRQRTVKYTADGTGFRASIKTNEPGIVAANPADVNINTAQGYGHQYQAPAQVYTTHVGGYTQSGDSGYGAGSSEQSSYGGY